MCGRYGRRADKQRIAEWMQTHNTSVFDDSYFAPSYNVAPQSLQPIVRLDSETGERELTITYAENRPARGKGIKASHSKLPAWMRRRSREAETLGCFPPFFHYNFGL
jgi:hypothetical protein